MHDAMRERERERERRGELKNTAAVIYNAPRVFALVSYFLSIFVAFVLAGCWLLTGFYSVVYDYRATFNTYCH
jgi:hypothetical protein